MDTLKSCGESVLNVRPSAEAEEKRVVAYFESTALNWHTMYSRADLWGEIHQQRLARFLAWVDELSLPEGTRAGDIGCGAGLATVALAQRGFFVEATDVASSMIELAQKNAKTAGMTHRVHADVGDIYRLGFPDEEFGLVLSIGVIPWLQFPAQAIAELARILKPGGYLLFTADNRWRLARLLDPWTSPFLSPVKLLLKKIFSVSRKSPTAQNGANSYRHSIHEVDAFLAKAGLERVRLQMLGFGPFTFFYRNILPEKIAVIVHRALQRLVDLRFALLGSTGSQFLLLARKRAVEKAHPTTPRRAKKD